MITIRPIRATAAMLAAPAAAMTLAASPAYAQVAGMTPNAMATAIATAFLGAGAAVSVAAGSFKAYQVWTGGRNPYEAVKYMLIGVALLFGTAAVVGFAG